MEDTYKKIGFKLLKTFKDGFEDSFFDKENLADEYKILQLPLNLSLRFQSWAGKPFYIILFKGNRYLYEMDLSRIIKKGSRFTWYLNTPTHKINKEVLDNNYSLEKEINEEYLNKVRNIKKLIESGVRVSKNGYKLCDNESWDTLSTKTHDLVSLIISAHSGLSTKNENETFDFDSKEAFEGYEFDQLIKSRKRDRKIINNRKILDKNTCQACGFNLVVNGNYIIDCHHINPIKYGSRKTEIKDLMCLCPTCHRISHQRRKPYSKDEIKNIINKKPNE